MTTKIFVVFCAIGVLSYRGCFGAPSAPSATMDCPPKTARLAPTTPRKARGVVHREPPSFTAWNCLRKKVDGFFARNFPGFYKKITEYSPHATTAWNCLRKKVDGFFARNFPGFYKKIAEYSPHATTAWNCLRENVDGFLVRNFPGLYKKITEYSPHATEFVIAVGTIVSVIAVVAVCKMLTSSGPVASNPGTATKNPLSPSGGESHLSSVGAGQALDGNAGGSLPVVSTENQFGGYVEQPVEGAKIREENQSFGSSSEVDIQPEVTTPISPVQSSSPITPTPTPALVQTPTPVSTPPAPVPTRTPTPTPTPTPQTPTPTPAPRPGLRLAHAEPTPTPGPVDSFRDYSNSIQVMELYYKRLNKEV